MSTIVQNFTHIALGLGILFLCMRNFAHLNVYSYIFGVLKITSRSAWNLGFIFD